jgi:hypothetical protein
MAFSDIDFRRLLPRGGSTRDAFEELCFLLCSSELSDQRRMIRRDGSGGDGGLEAYQPTPTGAVSTAMQAKQFENRVGPSQWKQIERSVRKTLEDNRIDGALTRYIVCTNGNFTASERKTWEERIQGWATEAKKLGYPNDIRFEHWGAAELREKLLKPIHYGLAIYFFGLPDLTLRRLWQVSMTTIDNLGERYLKRLHSHTSCESELSWFLRSPSALATFHELVSQRLAPELHRPWLKKNDWSPEAVPLAKHAHAALNLVLETLGGGCSWPLSVTTLNYRLQEFNNALHALTMHRKDELSTKLAKTDDAAYSTAREETGFVEGIYLDSRLDYVDCPSVLVVGDAGKGKSHVLAHLVSEYLTAEGCVVFLEGGSFTDSQNPWAQFLSLIDFNGSVQEFLSAFSTMSLSTNLTGLICIDALNESPDRNLWRSHLLTFSAEIRKYRNLKLLVSCRGDYLDLTLPPEVQKSSGDGWGRITQYGLDVDISRAIALYFKAYGVTSIPAQCFQEEFRNPLFLKLVCEAFRGRDIPISTLSLTLVLREYIKQKALLIQHKLDVNASQVESAIRELAGLFVTSRTRYSRGSLSHS